MYFDKLGVWPRLCTLKCGVTLASYGRPGFFIRATEDPSCLKWEDPIELIHDTSNVSATSKTCGYSDLMALDDHTACVAYIHFRYKDKEGIERKTVLFQTITIED